MGCHGKWAAAPESTHPLPSTKGEQHMRASCLPCVHLTEMLSSTKHASGGGPRSTLCDQLSSAGYPPMTTDFRLWEGGYQD